MKIGNNTKRVCLFCAKVQPVLPKNACIFLVPPKYIPCINLLFYVIKACIIAVGDDGVAFLFKAIQVVYYLAAKECTIVWQSWFIDDDLSTFCLDTFHYALYARLAEIVAV